MAKNTINSGNKKKVSICSDRQLRREYAQISIKGSFQRLRGCSRNVRDVHRDTDERVGYLHTWSYEVVTTASTRALARSCGWAVKRHNFHDDSSISVAR